jgi:hypothetical protein
MLSRCSNSSCAITSRRAFRAVASCFVVSSSVARVLARQPSCSVRDTLDTKTGSTRKGHCAPLKLARGIRKPSFQLLTLFEQQHAELTSLQTQNDTLSVNRRDKQRRDRIQTHAADWHQSHILSKRIGLRDMQQQRRRRETQSATRRQALHTRRLRPRRCHTRQSPSHCRAWQSAACVVVTTRVREAAAARAAAVATSVAGSAAPKTAGSQQPAPQRVLQGWAMHWQRCLPVAPPRVRQEQAWCPRCHSTARQCSATLDARAWRPAAAQSLRCCGSSPAASVRSAGCEAPAQSLGRRPEAPRGLTHAEGRCPARARG